MESLSRPLHRRKLSNANTFSGKNAYDGVFSGHRPNYDGPPPVNVEEYREIFCSGQSGSSIPVLDLSTLEESSDDFNLEVGSTMPDYGRIFGGFRDQDIAISYEELVARDKVRASSSTSQSSQDLGDLSHQSSDALKQFNLSYNKISQRSKDGIDGTTHVTQLHAVPGFTYFIDESASQPNKETVKQKSSSTNNVNVNSNKRSLSEKHTASNNVNVKSKKRDIPKKQTSRSSAECSKHQEESLSDNRIFKTFEADLSHPSKELSSPESKKEIEEQKPPATNNGPSSPPLAPQPEKETKKQKPPATDNVPSSQPATSQPNKEIEKQKPPVTNNGPSSPPLAPQSKKETEKQKPPATNAVPSSPPSASQPNKETEKQQPSATNNVPSSGPAAFQTKKETEKQKSTASNNVPSSPPSAFQPKMETEMQKPPARNNVPSSPPAAFQPKKETEMQKPPARNIVPSSPPVAFQPKMETEMQKPPTTNNVPSSAPAAFQPKKETEKQRPPVTNAVPSSPPAASKKETEKQKSSVTNNIHPGEKVDFPEKQASQNVVESQSRYGQDESFSDDRNCKTFKDNIKSYPSKASSSHAAPENNLANHKDYKKRSTATNEEFPPTCLDEERDVNSAAAALRKAIEKAQESIRIAKESVGRKKDGLSGFSSKSFKDSLKAKVRVAHVNASEEQKEKDDDKMKERDHKNGSTLNFLNFDDGEKLFGTKKVINEIHGKISESVTNSEIPIMSRDVLNNNKMVSNLKKVVGETETVSVENSAIENPHKDDERPTSFLELESCQKKQGDAESNNLTVCQKVETENETSQKSDPNDYEKKFSEESFGLLENSIQKNFEQEHDEEVASAERQDEDGRQAKEDRGTESHSEEDNFYDVCEVEMVKNAQTYAYSIETNDLSQKENYENHRAKETSENSSSDYDDAEENENVVGASNIVDDTEKACEVDQNDNNVAVSQDIDDVSSSHEFQVEYKAAVEKVIFENISDETEDNMDECEANSDNLENCGLADVDFGQNDVQFESSSYTIHGMEIEVKEYKREETVENEENNLQQSHEETPEIRIEKDTGTPHEPKDACRESELSKAAQNKEERERERIKLAVERAIREARERAFAEVRRRVIDDTQEKVTKASIDKTSAQSKLKADRALVERATAEARQRALEKAMKTSQPRTQVNETKQTFSTNQTHTESALRSKAKLEKHNRIMERAAKALAEKEKRDLLALREQAERSRLAEHLDADIKRWSTGKEGNLRALLSTLQYILGAESGWKPVSLTEIITTSAVKKAYRKATLCVHPDKLQQRGANIQQKYVCEKVFDLLKAAWNRFNSEER